MSTNDQAARLFAFARHKTALSLPEMARELNISPQDLEHIENGSAFPSGEALEGLLSFCGTMPQLGLSSLQTYIRLLAA